MYLNNSKSDTNIDNEFGNNNENNNKLSFKTILDKYKKIIIISVIAIIVLVVAIIIISNITRNNLVLNGETEMTIYQGTDYIEPGFEVYNSKDTDVIITSNVDTNKIGKYEIIYKHNNKTKKRIINVIAKPEEYTYIYLKTVNNDKNIYLKVGETYNEPGYQVFNSSGKNLTSKVKITGTVDTTKKGSYKLIYSVVDTNNVTVSVTRTIVVS